MLNLLIGQANNKKYKEDVMTTDIENRKKFLQDLQDQATLAQMIADNGAQFLSRLAVLGEADETSAACVAQIFEYPTLRNYFLAATYAALNAPVSTTAKEPVKVNVSQIPAAKKTSQPLSDTGPDTGTIKVPLPTVHRLCNILNREPPTTQARHPKARVANAIMYHALSYASRIHPWHFEFVSANQRSEKPAPPSLVQQICQRVYRPNSVALHDLHPAVPIIPSFNRLRQSSLGKFFISFINDWVGKQVIHPGIDTKSAKLIREMESAQLPQETGQTVEQIKRDRIEKALAESEQASEKQMAAFNNDERALQDRERTCLQRESGLGREAGVLDALWKHQLSVEIEAQVNQAMVEKLS